MGLREHPSWINHGSFMLWMEEEGVLPLEIKLLLKKYIKVEEYITLGTLNERIRTFDYGSSDISNKPSPIKEQALTNNSASLSQSGTKQYHCSKVNVYTCRSTWCFTHWYTNFCNFAFIPLYLILGARSSHKHLIVSLCQSAIQLLLSVFVFVAAAQMWCLARTLPLLIGDVVPESDPHWENFLCLLKIEEIVFSPTSSIQLAAFLAVLIEQYLDDFGALHNRCYIPKHHNMVHYPRQIVR